VDPARQKGGVGRALITAAEAWARERGCGFMDLRIVNLRAELPAFYRKLGYLEAGVEEFTPGAPTKIPCHFVKMQKALVSA
jgi:GNAT superfamily N-acetyltransferase